MIQSTCFYCGSRLVWLVSNSSRVTTRTGIPQNISKKPWLILRHLKVLARANLFIFGKGGQGAKLRLTKSVNSKFCKKMSFLLFTNVPFKHGPRQESLTEFQGAQARATRKTREE